MKPHKYVRFYIFIGSFISFIREKKRHTFLFACFFVQLLAVVPTSFGKDDSRIFIYDLRAKDHTLPKFANGSTDLKLTAIEENLFESTIKAAIQSLENSMKKTCAKEMEASIAVTAEGKWVVGVSIAGAIKVTIKNPELRKECQ